MIKPFMWLRNSGLLISTPQQQNIGYVMLHISFFYYMLRRQLSGPAFSSSFQDNQAIKQTKAKRKRNEQAGQVRKGLSIL